MKLLHPVLWCVAPAFIGWLLPAAGSTLLYDRGAILDGQWWRLWTGHWLHFSPSHLGWNVAVLAGAGGWLERLRPGSLPRFVLVAAPLLSAGLLAFAPDMPTYGGLSGLGAGVVVLLILEQLRRSTTSRAWWFGALALVGLKFGLDAWSPSPLFASFGTNAVRVSSLAHILGALAAMALFLARAGRAARD